MEQQQVLSLIAFTCGVVSAKWAMESGCSQLRQAIWGIAGLFFGPLALLMLYVRLLRVRQKATEIRESEGIGGRWFSSIAEGKPQQSVKYKPEISYKA